MDEMYGLHSSGDYADKALMSPENLMMTAADYSYSSFMSSNDHYHRIHMFGGGSDDVGAASASGFQRSAISEAASMTPEEFQRVSRRCGGGDQDDEEEEDEDACSVIKAKIASHPSYPKLLHAYIDCQKVELVCLFYDCHPFFCGLFCSSSSFKLISRLLVLPSSLTFTSSTI